MYKKHKCKDCDIIGWTKLDEDKFVVRCPKCKQVIESFNGTLLHQPKEEKFQRLLKIDGPYGFRKRKERTGEK